MRLLNKIFPIFFFCCIGETDETNSNSIEGILCCDRSHYRTDLCYIRGDIRTEPASNPANIFLYGAQQEAVTEKVPLVIYFSIHFLTLLNLVITYTIR